MRHWLLIAALSVSTMGNVGCVSNAKYAKLQARVDRLDARAEAQLKAFKELLADFQPLIDRGLLKVEVVDGRITLAVASDVLFASGSSELSAAGKKDLADITRLLARRVADRDFQVEGHTDSEPINSAQYPSNWHLGAARAIAVTQHMVANGFPEDHISAATFSDNAPVAANSSVGGRAQNRRIEIVLLPELSDLPGYKRLMAEQNGRSRGRGKGK
ncbi:MAG: OmpA family protein [Myxococcota bacterium]